MAHFAKLNTDNIVTAVEVIANGVITDENNNEVEQLGVDFLNTLYGTTDVYKQTSYNSTIRKNYAGIGSTYDSTRDAFIAPKPYTNWLLDETTCQYEPPIDFPADAVRNGGVKKYQWNEGTASWEDLVE